MVLSMIWSREMLWLVLHDLSYHMLLEQRQSLNKKHQWAKIHFTWDKRKWKPKGPDLDLLHDFRHWRNIREYIQTRAWKESSLKQLLFTFKGTSWAVIKSLATTINMFYGSFNSSVNAWTLIKWTSRNSHSNHQEIKFLKGFRKARTLCSSATLALSLFVISSLSVECSHLYNIRVNI